MTLPMKGDLLVVPPQHPAEPNHTSSLYCMASILSVAMFAHLFVVFLGQQFDAYIVFPCRATPLSAMITKSMHCKPQETEGVPAPLFK